MPDGDQAHGSVVSELIGDAVGADPLRPQPGEPSAQLVAGVRVALELTERIQDRIRAQVVECGQGLPCRAGEEDPCH